MNYIVFDLELNSKPFKNRHPNEIIEIGAVKLNDELETIDTFQSFVQPRVYKKLFSIVKRKTSIKQDDISNAPTFRNVLSDFMKWIEDDYVLCSWGHDDIHHLKLNCELNRRSAGWINRTLDVQKLFSKVNNLPKGQTSSLKSAIEMLDISIEGSLHRADVDALYTAEVFKRIYQHMHLLEQV